MSNDGAEKKRLPQFGTRDLLWLMVVCALVFSSWRATREHERAIEYMEKSFREDYDRRLKFAVVMDRSELGECKDSMKVLESRLMQLDAVVTKYEQERVLVVPGPPPKQKQ